MLFLDSFIEKLTDWFMEFFLDPAYVADTSFGPVEVPADGPVAVSRPFQNRPEMKKALKKPVFTLIFLKQKLNGLSGTGLQGISDIYRYLQALPAYNETGATSVFHSSGYYIKLNRGNLKWLNSFNMTG